MHFQSRNYFLIFHRAFDFKTERGEACSPNSLTTMQNVLVRLKKIRFFKGDIQSGSSFHISIGHNTVQATMTLFVDKTKEGMSWYEEMNMNMNMNMKMSC